MVHFSLKGNGVSGGRHHSSYPRLHIRGGGESSRSAAVHGTGSGRIKWTDEEVEYLKEGVERFGFGSWKTILNAYPFHNRRSNVDLKDKWRNLQKKM